MALAAASSERQRASTHADKSLYDRLGGKAAISAVVNASQNQVVAINRGSKDGMERGHVLAILKDGARIVDKTDPDKAELKLPDERNGLLMVFRTFERLSYALVLDITEGVRVGDRLTNPR